MDENKLNKFNNVVNVYLKEFAISANASGNTLMFFLWFFVAMSVLLRSMTFDATQLSILKYVALISGFGKYIFEYMVAKNKLRDDKK